MTSFILQSINDRPSSFPSLIPSSTPRTGGADVGSLLPPGECAFCDIIAGYSEAWKVYEDEMVVAFLDIYPLRQAHTLLVPKSHHARLADLPKEMGAALGSVMPSIVQAIGKATGNRDLNVVCNQGYAQEVHVGVGLCGRITGDTNLVDALGAPIFEHEKPITSRSQVKDKSNKPRTSSEAIDHAAVTAVTAVTAKENGEIPAEKSTPSSSPTHGWMRKREMYKRVELDDDQADELVEKIRSRL